MEDAVRPHGPTGPADRAGPVYATVALPAHDEGGDVKANRSTALLAVAGKAVVEAHEVREG